MNPAPVYTGPDRLRLARQQLDFAQMAQAAPTTREILYKSQTFVPMAPPRPWSRIAAGSAAVLVLAAALLLPWVAQRSSLVTVSAFFDKLVARQDAQAAINNIGKDIPSGLLLGAFYTPQGLTPPASDQGRLKLSFTCANRSEDWLVATASALLKENMPRLQPDHLQPVQMGGTRYVSPLRLVQQYIQQRSTAKQDSVPGSQLAAQVLENQDLIGQRLGKQLGVSGQEMTGFTFLAPASSPSPGRDEFVVSAWPSRVLVGVRDYGTRTAEEQNKTRVFVEQFLSNLNLGVSSALLTDSPSLWQPIVVEVLGPGGLTDRYLTDRLQAWLVQPDRSELTDINFDVVKRVEDALQKVAGDRECRIDFELVNAPGASSVEKMYRVSVSLTGGRKDTRPEPSDLNSEDYNETDF